MCKFKTFTWFDLKWYFIQVVENLHDQTVLDFI